MVEIIASVQNSAEEGVREQTRCLFLIDNHACKRLQIVFSSCICEDLQHYQHLILTCEE